MFEANCTNEFIVKCIGKLSLEFPELDQLKVRDILYQALENYEVKSTEQSLVASDLDEKINTYLIVKKMEGTSNSTLRNYSYVLYNFASIVYKPVNTITTDNIRMYLRMTTNGNMKTTTNTKQSILKSFFGWLYEEELIVKNPMLKIKQIKTPTRLRKPLSLSDIELLRLACKTPRERAVLELFYATGCRVSEMCDINLEDLNMESCKIRIIGKGDKEREVYFSEKTKIYINKYLEVRKGTDEALFVSMNSPYQRITIRSMEYEISHIAKRTNVKGNVFPHRIRTTTATHGYSSGASLGVIQKLLGHTNPSVTQRYAQIDEENVKHEYKQCFIH